MFGSFTNPFGCVPADPKHTRAYTHYVKTCHFCLVSTFLVVLMHMSCVILDNRPHHSVARQCYTVVRATQRVNGKWQYWPKWIDSLSDSRIGSPQRRNMKINVFKKIRDQLSWKFTHVLRFCADWCKPSQMVWSTSACTSGALAYCAILIMSHGWLLSVDRSCLATNMCKFSLQLISYFLKYVDFNVSALWLEIA